MTDSIATTEAVVETPKRRFRISRPSAPTLAKAGAVAGVFTAGVLVGVKWVKDACSCDTDNAEDGSTDQSTD